MRALEFFPSPSSAPFISKFIYLENHFGTFGFRAIPRNYPAIIIAAPESTSWVNIVEGKDYKMGNTGGVAVYFAGMGFSPTEMQFDKDLKVWILMLQPQAARLFFGDAAKAFVNNIFCVTDTHPQWRFFSEALWDKPFSLTTSVQLIETFIAKFLIKTDVNPSYLIAKEQIIRSNGTLSMKEIAENAYTCNRNLLRLFDDYIGVNPKTYSAMIRFSKLTNELIQYPTIHLEELAFRYNYHDLPHLHKDAVRFLNIPLSEIKNQTKSLITNML